MADTTRMRALKSLSTQLPVANSKVAAGQNAARQMQIQSAVSAAPTTQSITKSAEDTGTAAATNAGQQMVQGAQQGIQQQGQIGQVGLLEQGRQNQSEVAGLASGAKAQAIDNVSRLAALDARAKDELYDKQMKFARDENGRTLFNENQLADYARMKAGSDEQFRSYAQAATHASTRKLQVMEMAYKKITEDMNFKYAQAKQTGDQATQRQIAQDRADMEARMSREQARAANSAAAWQTGGTIAGAVVGSVIPGAGTAAGAIAGASIGSAAGSLAGGL